MTADHPNSEITLDDIRSALSDRFGSAETDWEISPYFHSHRAWRVTRGNQRLFLKEIGVQNLVPAARKFRRHSPFRVYSQETDVYRLLEPFRFAEVPRYLGTISLAGGGSLLALQYVEGRRLWEFPFGSTHWQQVARSSWHLSRCLGEATNQSLVSRYHLLDGAKAMSILGPARLRAATVSPQLSELLEQHLAPLANTLRAIDAGPWGWLHGQLYSINLLATDDPEWPDRVIFVDWETLSFGPALFDLACLLFYHSSTCEGRSAILDAYFEAGNNAGSPATRRATEQLLLHTEIFNQLWMLATLSEDWWSDSSNPQEAADRLTATRKAISLNIGELAHFR